MKTIARCEKCGRGFVTMAKEGVSVDHDPFFPANKPGPREPTGEVCGGRIVPIPEGEQNE